MEVEKPPFTPTKLESERDDNYRVISVKFNKDELAELNKAMVLLQQEKESTAIKQCMKLGFKVVLDQKNAMLLEILAGNLRRNERLGIVAVEGSALQK